MNFYDSPAQQQFIDTYAALPFQEMAMLGNVYKAERDRTEAQLDAYKSQYGNFQSLSKKDIEGWDSVVGIINPALDKMSTNPDYIKSQEGQAEIRNLIRSVDTGKLNMLKQSSENLQKRAQIIAQMKANGTYKEEWDDIDIEQWDTLGSGKILNDLAPIEYKNAYDLSSSYYKDIKAGALPSRTINGVRYLVKGNNESDLRAIAQDKHNDLINTPQGQKYYEGFLKQTKGDEAKATEMFQNMIVGANQSRIIRPDMTVDPAWLMQEKNKAAKAAMDDKSQAKANLYDFVNASYTSVVKSKINNNLQSYRDYMESVSKKYGADSKITKDALLGLRNIDRQFSQINEYRGNSQKLAINVQQYEQAYQSTGNDQYLVKAQKARSAAAEFDYAGRLVEANLLKSANKPLIRKQFQEAAGFQMEEIGVPTKFSHSGYNKGVKRVLSMYDFKLSDRVSKDILLDNLGGAQEVFQDKSGSKTRAYQFNTSDGFKLPETVLALQIGPKALRNTDREAGSAASGAFPVKQIIESGRLRNVQFIPDNTYQKIMSESGEQYMAKGKLRISKDELREQVGSGILTSGQGFKDFMSGLGTIGVGMPFSKESVDSAMRRIFDAKDISEVVGDDEVEYYEIDIVKDIPNSEEFIHTTNQIYQNSDGVGGASQAAKAYDSSAKDVLN